MMQTVKQKEVVSRTRWPRTCATCRNYIKHKMSVPRHDGSQDSIQARTCMVTKQARNPNAPCSEVAYQFGEFRDTKWEFMMPLLEDYLLYLDRGGYDFRAGETLAVAAGKSTTTDHTEDTD